MLRSVGSLGATLCLLALAGCAEGVSGLFGGGRADESPPVSVQTAGAETPRPAPRGGTAGAAAPRTAAAFDTSSPEERAAALAAPARPGQELGRTVASLGSPSEGGFWLRTGLVQSVTPGRVRLAGGTASVAVELRPSGRAPGSGSELSLAAYQALGIPLTSLPELVVLAE